MTDADQPRPVGPAEPLVREPGRLELGAVLFLVGAELLAGLFPVSLLAWMTGNALLALSAVWTLRDKARGWFFIGGGYLLVGLLGRSAPSLPGWALFVGIALLVVFFVMQILTVRRLLSVRMLSTR